MASFSDYPDAFSLTDEEIEEIALRRLRVMASGQLNYLLRSGIFLADPTGFPEGDYDA